MRFAVLETGGTITGVAPRARLMLLSGHAVHAYQYALLQGADILSMSFSVPKLGNGRGLWRLMSEHAVCAGDGMPTVRCILYDRDSGTDGAVR